MTVYISQNKIDEMLRNILDEDSEMSEYDIFEYTHDSVEVL